MLSDDDDGIVVEALSSGGSDVASDRRRPSSWSAAIGASSLAIHALALGLVLSAPADRYEYFPDGDRSASQHIDEQTSGFALIILKSFTDASV